MDGDDAAIRACLAHKANLEDTPAAERPRLLTEIVASEALIQRLRSEDRVQAFPTPPRLRQGLGPATTPVPVGPLPWTHRASTE